VQVVTPEETSTSGAETAVTIGAYDGVHLGHRMLLGLLRSEADQRGLASAVVTFDRHPATVVRPESAPLLLTDTEQKLELLAACGVDVTVVVPFDERRANETAEEFVERILVQALRARLVVVGEDFHFGHGRKGNVALLEELGRAHGFEVVGVALAGADGSRAGAPLPGVPGPSAEHEIVSSTRIRRLVADGHVAAATALLGRPHEVRGTVVRGDGRGASELGFPTANLAVPEGIAVPGVGIYAGWFRRAGGNALPAAISVGRRPTFYGDPAGGGALARPLVEAYVLDFAGDLYGERVAVAFVERLREERRFERVGDLVLQMEDDVARTRSLLGA
jgi:riboflavin kinase / FMN adenylyltransferase